jgi:hypothetical protein
MSEIKNIQKELEILNKKEKKKTEEMNKFRIENGLQPQKRGIKACSLCKNDFIAEDIKNECFCSFCKKRAGRSYTFTSKSYLRGI